MKKIYLVAACIITGFSVNAQSQRMVLAEEFTQASCGPCAAANPAFNALLANNSAKVVAIKYQVSWPGVDPMNAQYGFQVQNRVNYYGVQGVPHALLDGADVLGPNYAGHPANCTQTMINNQYAWPSSFTIDVSHVFNAAMDSIFVTAVITSSQAYTATGFLRAHVVMIEKHIDFASPPGSNGETDFYGVCRKMFPTASGNTLPATWASGATQTLTIASSVPTYIYDLNEIAIVCFIQDNGNKEVQQAAISLSPVGIADFNSTNTGISLFPNPANQTTSIKFTLTQGSDVVLNIYNAVGQLVSTENKGTYAVGEQSILLGTEMLENGMYVIELVSEGSKSVTRLNVHH